MRDWAAMYIAPIGAWLIASVDWNQITLASACIASVCTAGVTITCGVSKIIATRQQRKNDDFVRQCAAMRARNSVCSECISDGGSFAASCNFKYRHLRCPKNQEDIL